MGNKQLQAENVPQQQLQKSKVQNNKEGQPQQNQGQMYYYEEEEEDDDDDLSNIANQNKQKQNKQKENKAASQVTVEGIKLDSVSEQNKFQAFTHKRKATKVSSNLDKAQLTVSASKYKKQYGLDSQILKVDFSVIMVRMSDELRETFTTLGHKIYTFYAQHDTDKQWKLHGNGYFINYEQGYNICIINENMVYKGITFLTPTKDILPDIKGILIDKKGMYSGGFHKGKAHGYGHYESKPNEKKQTVIYEGEWKNGILVTGIIKNKIFKFKGEFVNGVANGPGAIKFLKTNSLYKGNFKDGKYHAIGDPGTYKTEDYIYIGDFIDGKKEGNGCLTENKYKKFKLGAKYRPPDVFDGQWIDDYYVTKRKIREQRKLLKQEGQEMMADVFEFVLEKESNGKTEMSEFMKTKRPMGMSFLPNGSYAGQRQKKQTSESQKKKNGEGSKQSNKGSREKLINSKGSDRQGSKVDINMSQHSSEHETVNSKHKGNLVRGNNNNRFKKDNKPKSRSNRSQISEQGGQFADPMFATEVEIPQEYEQQQEDSEL